MADDRIKKGLALADRMFGEQGGRKRFEAATEFTKPLNDYAVGTCFGDVWQRPGLDHKTRSMLTIAMLTALGQQPQLRVHVRGALSNGVTKEEIREILVHAIIYCGLPRAVDAFTTAGEILDQAQ